MTSRQKTSRFIAIFSIAALIATLLSGCGSAPQSQAATASPLEPAPDSYTTEDMQAPTGGSAGSQGLTLPQDDRKITLTAYLGLESLAFEDTCAQLQQKATALGGYISATDFYGNDQSTSRSASFTIKIPAEKYSEFLEAAGNAGNLVSRSEQTEDVTDYYVDVEARLKGLRAQEESLLAMMGQADELSDLILIQEQLSNVQYEIESYVVQQRSLDGRIAYSTVHATVQEVRHITEAQDTYFQRVANAFREGWRAAGKGLQSLSVWLIWMLPVLLLLGVVLIVVLVVRRNIRKKRAKNPPATHNYPPAPPYFGAPYSPYPPYPVPRVEPPKEDTPAAQAPPADSNETHKTEK